MESTEAFRAGKYDWRKTNHVSSDSFSHCTYAIVHTYDCNFIHALQIEDCYAT